MRALSRSRKIQSYANECLLGDTYVTICKGELSPSSIHKNVGSLFALFSSFSLVEPLNYWWAGDRLCRDNTNSDIIRLADGQKHRDGDLNVIDDRLSWPAVSIEVTDLFAR